MKYVKVNKVAVRFHLFEKIGSDLGMFWLTFTCTKSTQMAVFHQKHKLYMLLVLSDDSKFDSDDASHAVTAADNALKYAFAHCACCACTPYPFWSHGKTWLPPLLNIDVLGGLRWVNKSWNIDKTTFKEMESVQTSAMCDAWMLRQERGMHESGRYAC